MSNPWRTTPNDVALAPLLKSLKEFEPSTPIKSISLDEELDQPQTTEETAPKVARSALIAKLRRADEIHRNRRADPNHGGLSPENEKLLNFSRRLTKVFVILSRSLEQFQKADILKTAYLQAFLSNQVVWDDISQENKTKMVNSLRFLIKAIQTLLVAKQDSYSATNSYKQCAEELKVIIERSEIMNNDRSCDEYLLEDLFEVLTEISGCLEVIRVVQQSSSSFSPVK